ncbi:MAG: hypothetical protein NC253_09495 [Ruminococcus sp.]|nr:hypothetical protein [Ruminococcus sp.]MCM1382443.1 hypothetical protein [Muribaculaceae bacterium]MCM1479463.1 hypothetical protein [Muribaculaceae bacterium]
MRALFLIADYGCTQTVREIFEEEGLPCRFMLRGHGSADSATLDYLGLGDNKKIIAVTFAANGAVLDLYRIFNDRLSLRKAGRGIAFAVPVSGASGLAYALNGTNAESEEETEMSEPKYELIITIVNRGGFEAVKEASKAAGARGGTLLHGLGLGGEEAAKFLGISIQPEKDIVLIVVEREDREKVMQGILDKAGILTENRGICFSLPVDSALGLAGKNDDISQIINS